MAEVIHSDSKRQPEALCIIEQCTGEHALLDSFLTESMSFASRYGHGAGL